MSKRVRLGLGFVVIAVLLWLIAIPLQAADGGPARAAYAVVLAGMVATGLFGLVTLAWGLIRD